MNLSQHAVTRYPTEWAYLQQRGWSIKPVRLTKGTARANHHNKTIEVKPAAYHKPNRRHTLYVLRHEIWHALHYETLQWECDTLRNERNLTWKSAIEVVAETACLHTHPGPTMKLWVNASTIWHNRVGYKYNRADTTSQQALDTVRRIAETYRA